MKIIEKSILLTFDEIRILLYSMNVSEIEGVYMPEKIFQEEEILAAMHHMSTIGIIVAEKERFRIREDVKRILEIMAVPEWTKVWYPSEEEGPAFFLYGKEELTVVSEQYFRKKDTLKLTIFAKDAFEKWREELMNDYRRS